MPQVFRRRANAIAIWVIVLVVAGGSTLTVAGTLWLRSSFVTGTRHPVGQPVPFSHEHHVGGLGIDCRYCHTSVEVSASAGLPATEVCMTCHSQLWTNAKVLEPVRESLASGQPIHWNRVNTLADFVFFNHSIHVNKGVACVTCHGQVDDMPLTWRENPMQMSWCLSCHRDPAPHLHAKTAVFSPVRQPDSRPAAQQALLDHYGIKPETMTDCYVCHR